MQCQNMWHKLCISFCLKTDHVLKKAIKLEKISKCKYLLGISSCLTESNAQTKLLRVMPAKNQSWKRLPFCLRKQSRPVVDNFH